MIDVQRPKKVAVLSEGTNWAIALAHAVTETLHAMGYDADILDRDALWEKAYDLVLGYGPHTWPGSLLATADQLETYGESERPFFYWWYTDAPFRPDWPSVLSKLLAKLHVKTSLFFRRYPRLREAVGTRFIYRRFAMKHFRLRNFGELFELQSRDLIDGLAVTAVSRAAYFNRLGLEPIVAPMGYHPSIHGQYLGLERDSDVIFFGGMHGKRRQNLLRKVEADLKGRGIALDIRRDGFHGDERTNTLNRTKTALNILQYPYDIVALRFMFCAASKVLLISEPVVDQEPFVPGYHFVSAPIEELAETVEYYLAHEKERQEIVERAYRLVTEEYTIEKMVERLLEHAFRPSAEKRR